MNCRWAKYKRLRNKVTHEIKLEKMYHENEIHSNAGDRNGMWKAIRRVLNKKHTNNVPQDLLPDACNDFLAHVGA